MDNETGKTALEDIVEEYLKLLKTGEAPDIEHYAKKYPEFKDELLDILPLVGDLNSISKKRTTISDEEIKDNFKSFDYKLIKRLAQGGMGTVFLAEQTSLKRNVAIKILKDNLLIDKEKREGFEKEAQTVAMLHHPNIVKILSAKCNNKNCYFAMEFIEGKSLNNVEFKSIKEIAETALQIAEGLSYAHKCGITHRDIKPANILLDNDMRVHITDFGLSAVLEDGFFANSKTIKKQELKSGTIKYMAPEKLLKGKNSCLCDIYSFGAALYEITTKHSFVEACDTKELIEKITDGKIPKLNSKNKSFNSIINKCLNYAPDKRYQSIDEIISDIEKFLNNEPVSSCRYNCFEKYLLWKKRNPFGAIFGLIALIFAIAFIFSMMFGFIQTKNALNLAQKNANLADITLTNVFKYVESSPPSKSGTALLNTLMPYYIQIAEQKNAKKRKIN